MKRNLLFSCCIFICCLQNLNADNPNIVVVLADDLGYGDVQPLNSDSKIETPNFNRLAKTGITFTDAHSPSAVCTPTRYGLMCGRYCWRTSLKRGVLGGYSKPLINLERQTIATVLKSAGYRTGCVGKWHLGLGWQWHDEPKDTNKIGIAGNKSLAVDYEKPLTHGPNTLGFDFSYIIPASLDMSPYVYVRNHKVTAIPDRLIDGEKFPGFYRKGVIADDFEIEGVLDRLTEQACQFIADSKSDQPFFLYFPLSAPHKPVSPHERFKGKTKLGPYGDFVTQVDWTVGEIMKALDEKKVADNTLLIVTSDNGSFMNRINDKTVDHSQDFKVHGYNPANHKPNGILRGTKADIWEAGHRVPFFARWPSKIKPDSICHETVCHTDILATAADVVKQTFDQNSAEDSFSFLKLLQGETRERPAVIHHSIGGMFAIRSGNWKLVMGNGSGGRQKPKGKPFEGPFHLFDLSNDLSEKNNLIESMPTASNRMFKEFVQLSHKGGPLGKATDSKQP